MYDPGTLALGYDSTNERTGVRCSLPFCDRLGTHRNHKPVDLCASWNTQFTISQASLTHFCGSAACQTFVGNITEPRDVLTRTASASRIKLQGSPKDGADVVIFARNLRLSSTGVRRYSNSPTTSPWFAENNGFHTGDPHNRRKRGGRQRLCVPKRLRHWSFSFHVLE